MPNPTRVIATAGVISVAVGSVNALAKDKKLPSAKFLIGSGVAFLILSAIADAGEPELAQALAIAVCTTVVIGDGGGVLSYINNGEIDTQKKKKGQTGFTGVAPKVPTSTDYQSGVANRPTNIVGSGLTPRPNLAN